MTAYPQECTILTVVAAILVRCPNTCSNHFHSCFHRILNHIFGWWMGRSIWSTFPAIGRTCSTNQHRLGMLHRQAIDAFNPVPVTLIAILISPRNTTMRWYTGGYLLLIKLQTWSLTREHQMRNGYTDANKIMHTTALALAIHYLQSAVQEMNILNSQLENKPQKSHDVQAKLSKLFIVTVIVVFPRKQKSC
jgi:hypothetical protein